MPPELTRDRERPSAASLLQRVPAGWAAALGWLAFVCVAAVLLTAQQWVDMARQWLTVSAYQHILFVPPIIAWLVWNRREVLAGMTPQAWWPGVALVVPALLIWLIGSLTSLDIVAQAGAVLILQTATIALLGPRIGAVLLFPLAFAAFLVPFGEEIVPPLQMLTADMVIALTHLSGIEAEIDGVFIDTPAGLFEVAAACAGVQFVVAMVTLGVLAAKVGMERWSRRIALMALCVVVPILANGVRAWAIVAIAQYVGAERAGGVDHIVYGWLFFAIVVALVLAIAWRWFDRDPEAEGRAAARLAHDPLVVALDKVPARAVTLAPVLVASIVLFGLWGGLAHATGAPPQALQAPDVAGWTQVEPREPVRWQPEGAGARSRMHAIYRDGGGHEVDLYLAEYGAIGDPTATGEGAVPPDSPWREVGPASAPPGMLGTEIMAYGTQRRLAWTSYVGDGSATSEPLHFRLAGLGKRLFLRPEPRWLVIVSADATSGRAGRDALDRFHADAKGPEKLVASAVSR